MSNIYFFEDGSRNNGNTLGLKGSNLCEMSKVVDVPEGFILSTSISGNLSSIVREDIISAIRKLEDRTNKKYGAKNIGEIPLLLSIRASPLKPIPRLMHSILNVGLNDTAVERLAEMPGASRRFALDTYQRFLQMFGCFVLSVESERYDEIIKMAKSLEGVKSETELSEQGLQYLVDQFKNLSDVPHEPFEQLWLIIQKIYESTLVTTVDTDEGEVGIGFDSTAIIIQRMVFGNLNSHSGTGTCFSSVVNVGGNIHGNYLPNAEGNDNRLNDHRAPHKLFELGSQLFHQLEESMKKLELHFHHNFQYVEYTVENGHLYFLETNCVKTNPHYVNGNYLVSVENTIYERDYLDGVVDPLHPHPPQQYIPLESTEITESITENPLLSGTVEENFTSS